MLLDRVANWDVKFEAIYLIISDYNASGGGNNFKELR